MILAFCLLGILYGLTHDGRMRSIGRKHFRFWPLLFMSLTCEWLLSSAWFHGALAGMRIYSVMPVIFAIIQYGLITIFLFRNWRKPGLLAVLAGSTMNGLVIIANGGKMPIVETIYHFSEDAVAKISQAPHYFLAVGSEPLLFLADRIPLWIYMISVGDLFIGVGMFFLGAYLPRRILRPRPSAEALA
ncbi:MAG: DUF5317 family protein [Bacillota bacterium]|nr:DUF5317 family protein [Bacillota bacterium]